MQDVLHEDARRMHLVRLYLARLDEVFDLRERHARGGRHHRVEVPGRLSEDKVAGAITDERAFVQVPEPVLTDAQKTALIAYLKTL